MHAIEVYLQNSKATSLAGIYIHIPFCRQACHYCNFHFSTSLHLREPMLSSIQKEISLQKDFIDPSERIDTIYFGGGTPSILSAGEINGLLEMIHRTFSIAAHPEITLEANPDDVSFATVVRWMQSGINRLSMGIQSFHNEELVWMNRSHTAQDSLKCIDEIIMAGIQNFSADLIFGSPLLSDAQLQESIGIVLQKNIPHLSCYALTVEPKTALGYQVSKKIVPPTDPDKQAAQFLMLSNQLQAGGYEHYEISNYARPGMHSRHNSSYWKGKPYYGFGPSAHSFNGNNRRRWNISNNALYIQSLQQEIIPFEEETLSSEQQLNEYIMTSLRTAKGLQLDYVLEKFGNPAKASILKNIDGFISDGKVLLSSQDAILLTTEGKLFADGIAAALFV